jgi:DNA-binding transcriptional LysR family regulator
MAALETELGARLFQRSTRRVALTEAGELFLGKVEPLVTELDGALDEARQVSAEPAGTLRLTASVTFGQLCIVPLIPEFRQRHPGVKLDCIFTDENLDLVANRIDLAIRLAPTVEGDLVAARLMDTPYRVVASPAYLSSAPPLRSPADLAGHSCLLPPYQVFRPNWLFKDMQGHVTEVPVQGDVTLSTFTALRDLTVLGLGPALLPYWLVAGLLRDGVLVDLFSDYAATATTFDTAAWIVYPSRAYLPRKVRVMVDFLKDHFASTIA